MARASDRRQAQHNLVPENGIQVREKVYIPFFNMVPDILPEEEFFQVHPVVKQLFFKRIPKSNLAGTLKCFLQELKILPRTQGNF